MDKKIAGLLGAVGAFASLDAAQAAVASDPAAELKARSFAELLSPIADAAAKLKSVDAGADAPRLRVAENAHHHHHHHSYRRPRPIIVVPRRHHHHHHHHHHMDK